MTDYEKLCEFNNLYKAHLRSRKGKRHKSDVIKFELDLANQLIRLQDELINRTYKMGGYYNFFVYEPKKRCVFATNYRDRVLQHCLSDEVLAKVLQKRMIYDNTACQIGKGTHFAIKRFTKFISEHGKLHGTTGYFLKCDIRKYFDSIDHEILKTKLSKVIVDSDVKNLLFHFIDSYNAKNNFGKGLPLGNQSSQWFALYYLDSLDRLVKEKLQIKHYIRYMDDFILMHQDKKVLQNCLFRITTFLKNELKLSLNHKTQICPIRCGVEFIGFRFYLTKNKKVIRKLKKQTKLRFNTRLKKIKKDYKNGEITQKEFKMKLASFRGHLKHGHTYRLVQKHFVEKNIQFAHVYD